MILLVCLRAISLSDKILKSLKKMISVDVLSLITIHSRDFSDSNCVKSPG